MFKVFELQTKKLAHTLLMLIRQGKDNKFIEEKQFFKEITEFSSQAMYIFSYKLIRNIFRNIILLLIANPPKGGDAECRS